MATSITRIRGDLTLGEKLVQIPYGLLFTVAVTASIGFAMLYSAAGGSWEPWASRQVVRFGVGMALLLCVAVIDIRFWFRIAYVFYGVALVLIAMVLSMNALSIGFRVYLRGKKKW